MLPFLYFSIYYIQYHYHFYYPKYQEGEIGFIEFTPFCHKIQCPSTNWCFIISGRNMYLSCFIRLLFRVLVALAITVHMFPPTNCFIKNKHTNPSPNHNPKQSKRFETDKLSNIDIGRTPLWSGDISSLVKLVLMYARFFDVLSTPMCNV